MLETELHRSPFHRFLDFTIVHAAAGNAELHLPLRPDFLRMDGSDWIHGGVIASLIDIAANFAASSLVDHAIPTVDLRVDYMRPSRGALTARGKMRRAGRSLAFVDVEIEDSTGRITAVGRAVFALAVSDRPSEKEKQ